IYADQQHLHSFPTRRSSDLINQETLPQHIAIIMDGNGRWAKGFGKLRIFGHQNGVTAVREALEGCVEIGVKYLTLYAFSSENWRSEEHTSELQSRENLVCRL